MLNVNEYFEGKVKSIGFKTNTLAATVGVMVAGEYDFSTNQKETMTIVSGALTVKLPDTNDWQTFNQGEYFIVEKNNTFQLKVDVNTAYFCTYE